MRRLALIALLVALAGPAVAGPAGQPVALYGPTIRTDAGAHLLLRRMDEGPPLSTQSIWFADRGWLAKPIAVRLLGAHAPRECVPPGARPPTEGPGAAVVNASWDTMVDAGPRLIAAEHWKAAREALLPALLPECPSGTTPDRRALHGALIDLARAAWYGYPADEHTARSALRSAVRVAPEAGWSHPGENALETVWLEERNALVHQQRGAIFAPTTAKVFVDGERLRRGPTDFVPGDHLLEIRDDGGATLQRARLTIESGATVVIGTPEELWPWVSNLKAPDETAHLHQFARAALADTYGSYWLLAGGRPVFVEADGNWRHPHWRGRFVLGVELRTRFLARDTQAPVVLSKAPTSLWFAPRITLGFQARTKPGGPLVGLRASGTWMISPPVLFADVTAVRVLPGARLGASIGMSRGKVRIDGAVYGEVLVAGRQVVQRPVADHFVVISGPTVFVGGTAEVQAAFRISRFFWATFFSGAGWVGSPTLSGGVGIELRAWDNR